MSTHCFSRHAEHRIRNTFRAPTMPKKNHKKDEGTRKKHWICRHQKYLEELPLGYRDLGNVMARHGTQENDNGGEELTLSLHAKRR